MLSRYIKWFKKQPEAVVEPPPELQVSNPVIVNPEDNLFLSLDELIKLNQDLSVEQDVFKERRRVIAKRISNKLMEQRNG